jgi:outer membrane protein
MTTARMPDRQRLRRSLLAALWGLLPASAHADLTLSQAITLALENDPAYAGAFAAQRADRELAEQLRSGLRPTVNFRAGGQVVATDSRFAFGEEKDEYTAWSAQFEARQPIFRSDWFDRLDQAEAQEALADATFRQQQIDFVVRVASRYIDALLAYDQLVLREAEVASVERALADVQKRFDVELVPGVDLREAQARFDLTRAQLIRAEAERDRALDTLAEVIGPFDTGLPRLQEGVAMPELPTGDVDGWLAVMDESNTALQAARLRVLIAEKERISRQAEARPQADLVASAGRVDLSEYALGSRQDDAIIGVELNIPLYTGGRASSQVRAADARLEEARQERERLRRETARQLRAEFRDYQAARITDQALQLALESAQVAHAAVRAGYDAGTRTITDVLDSERRIAEAQRDLNQARYELLTRLLSLQSVAGTLTRDDVTALDVLFEAR